PAPLEELGVAPALASVCRQALEKNRDARHQSVEALYAELSAALEQVNTNATLPINAVSTSDSAPTVSKQFSRPLQSAVPALAPTIAMQGSPSIHDSNLVSAQGKKQLKHVRNFAVVGGLLLFVLSIGVGFLLRWVGLSGMKLSYDEFALALITDAFRDSIFGAFLGAALSGLRRSLTPSLDWRSRVAKLIIYAGFGGAIAMAPFVI